MKEKEHSKMINEKNNEIKNLVTRIIELETELKVTGKEKEIMETNLVKSEAENEQKQN